MGDTVCFGMGDTVCSVTRTRAGQANRTAEIKAKIPSIIMT